MIAEPIACVGGPLCGQKIDHDEDEVTLDVAKFQHEFKVWEPERDYAEPPTKIMQETYKLVDGIYVHQPQ